MSALPLMVLVAANALAGDTEKSHGVFPLRQSKAHDEAHWSYDGESGPDHWAELSPEWGQCAAGKAQTPIDLNLERAAPVGLDDVIFHYHSSPSKIVNNGHTMQVNPESGNAIEVDGRYYELAQMHFHAPSEHRLNGRTYPMELHLVHKDAAGNLAVVGVFLDVGAGSEGFEPIFEGMTVRAGQEKPLQSPIDASALLPDRREYVRYTGSLTTPPCSEGVRWIVFDTPVAITETQLGAFTASYDHNSRPVQALNGRPVLLDATW